MKKRETQTSAEILKLLPSVDALLRSEIAAEILPEIGAKRLTVLARGAVETLRRQFQVNIVQGATDRENFSRESLQAKAETNLEIAWRDERNTKLRRVINATGVIIHTNLGRAPLSENAKRAISEEASGYCALEYNLETGGRGRRGARAEQLLAELTGAGDAVIVNNCAAACVLILTALAKGSEAIISRGELVEIGGDFRIPDVMTESGAGLREVGATNRTHVSDYEKAISDNTRLIVKVHPSNYRIVGFTETPTVKELADCARRNNILLYEDAGSGALFDLSEFGLGEEPVIINSIKSGADVVSFSGDKLLGGVQSGLIVGRSEVIERLRKHPLYRALRAGKLIYAALEATLESFRRDAALQEIPVLKMLAQTNAQLKKRAAKFAENLNRKLSDNSNLKFKVTEGKSIVGGGSAPTAQPPTTVLTLKHEKLSSANLEQVLRQSKPPVITRILEDEVLIDLRTVSNAEETELLEVLINI
ncbi:MAG: L-seryl-tRNA(Sec) selenium transferase [Acidobacteriota bacterium]|nr:L-seryl-tRNA(Sec) selenium transferase [Acidobacteriota bacterium]